MQLNHGLHLAYCTNIHRGEDWEEAFDSLQRYTLAVRAAVCPGEPYGLGLRLSARAARDLSDRATLRAFQKWLEEHQCYVFTLNGFPYGQFQGAHVKEQVYQPDWTQHERLDYTRLLFDLLADLLPDGIEGSVNTVPGSFRSLIKSDDRANAIQANLWSCIEHIDRVAQRTGKTLHLGLELEPLCYLETSTDAVLFFQQLRADRLKDDRWSRYVGVTYDACHLAVEFEEPADALNRLRQFGIKISKLQLGSALKVQPTPEVREALTALADDTYLHQVVERFPGRAAVSYRDLGEALAQTPEAGQPLPEWRIRFHIPLHSERTELFDNTTDHLRGALDQLQRNPALCSHLEMETDTWDVLPPEKKNRNVVDQLVTEHVWTLAELAQRGLA
jgi:sugar phosphate isomerase/epimerase